MKTMVLALGLAAVLAVVIGLSLAASFDGAQAQGQAGPAAPANIWVANGADTGQAVVVWEEVDEAAYYRIGWVNMETFRAVWDEGGREWLDVFAFYDVVNRGQNVHTITDLAPGVEYAFIIASVGQRFGGARNWSDWAYLTTEEAVSCPTDTGTVPVAPGGGATPTPAPTLWATLTPAPTLWATLTPAPTPWATLTPEPTPWTTPTPAPTLWATRTPPPTQWATPAPTATPTPTRTAAVNGDYDADDDGLIEISSLAQLDVIRHDLDGDGASIHADYVVAFPNALADMGCFADCSGYELAADLDFDTNGNGRSDAGDTYWNDGAGWFPVGDSEVEFRYNAVFDGNGHTIANLFIRRAEGDHLGLFRATGADADIRNVRLTGLRVSGRDWVGGLVGSSSGVIAGSSAAGRVSGNGGVGGLAGYNGGRISGSSAAADVSGQSEGVGGLSGISPGTITDSYASGEVSGRGEYVGGLVGSVYDRRASCGTISDSYAAGRVTGESDYVGGLIGWSCGTIYGSYATGEVTGEKGGVGGLAGATDSASAITAGYATGRVTGQGNGIGGLVGGSYGIITASYATGSVTGSSRIGGLVGYAGHNIRITASYAIGRVTGDSDVGGLVGERYDSSGVVILANSYWDTQTSSTSYNEGGAGKTTRELQTPTAATGIYANWNPDWWDFGASRQYPVLKYQGMNVAAQRQ